MFIWPRGQFKLLQIFSAKSRLLVPENTLNKVAASDIIFVKISVGKSSAKVLKIILIMNYILE